jgi:hypothetical protein
MNSSSEENINKLNLKDISIFYQNNFIDLTNISNNLYSSFSKIKIPENVKLLGKLYNYDLWDCNNQILIAFPNSPLKSWYKIRTLDDINTFLEYFNNVNLLNYQSQINLYLDNNIKFNQLIKIIYMNDFIEKIIYEDIKDIKNNRNKKLSQQEKIENLDYFLNKNNFMILSEYSKSLLEFKNFNNHNIVTIKYNKLNLRNRYNEIDKNIPSDINIILHNFNILSYQQILENPITYKSIDICEFILFNNKSLYKDILLNLIKNNNLDLSLNNYINTKINEIEIDEILHKTDKDGTFKAFENSLDILLKTLYEKLTIPDKNYEMNITYINNNIKTKINNLLDNKLI